MSVPPTPPRQVNQHEADHEPDPFPNRRSEDDHGMKHHEREHTLQRPKLAGRAIGKVGALPPPFSPLTVRRAANSDQRGLGDGRFSDKAHAAFRRLSTTAWRTRGIARSNARVAPDPATAQTTVARVRRDAFQPNVRELEGSPALSVLVGDFFSDCQMPLGQQGSNSVANDWLFRSRPSRGSATPSIQRLRAKGEKKRPRGTQPKICPGGRPNCNRPLAGRQRDESPDRALSRSSRCITHP